jgi:hypothetical protein
MQPNLNLGPFVIVKEEFTVGRANLEDIGEALAENFEPPTDSVEKILPRARP